MRQNDSTIVRFTKEDILELEDVAEYHKTVPIKAKRIELVNVISKKIISPFQFIMLFNKDNLDLLTFSSSGDSNFNLLLNSNS